ncbi:MAG: ABC transporter substrate-binding protein [Bacteroidota bacterium]|jgi:NitT/TauT family transport system substrate-binding protein
MAVFVALGCVFFAQTLTARAQLDKVVFAYPSTSLTMLPFYVAQEKSMYRDAGVEVDFVRVGAGNFYPALFSGQADVVHSNLVDPMTLRQKGQDVVAIGLFGYNFSTQFVLSKKFADSKGITSASPMAEKIAALKGARIAASGQGAGTDQQIRFLAALYGLDYQKDLRVTFIREGNAALTALLNGQIDGFVHVTPFYEMAIEKGAAIMLANFAKGEVKEADGYIQSGLISTSKVVGAKRDRLVKFLRGTTRGMEFILEPKNRDEVAAIAAKYVTDGKSSSAEMLPFLDAMIANGQVPKNALIEEKHFNVSRDFRNALLKIEGQPLLEYSYKDIVIPDLATEAMK